MLVAKNRLGKRGSLGRSHRSHTPQPARASIGCSGCRLGAGLGPSAWTESVTSGQARAFRFLLLSLATAPCRPLFAQAAARREVTCRRVGLESGTWRPHQSPTILGPSVLGACWPLGLSTQEQLCPFGWGKDMRAAWLSGGSHLAVMGLNPALRSEAGVELCWHRACPGVEPKAV